MTFKEMLHLMKRIVACPCDKRLNLCDSCFQWSIIINREFRTHLLSICEFFTIVEAQHEAYHSAERRAEMN